MHIERYFMWQTRSLVRQSPTMLEWCPYENNWIGTYKLEVIYLQMYDSFPHLQDTVHH